MKDKNEVLPVHDLWEASYLMAVGVKLVHVAPDRGLATFYFDNTNGVAAEQSERFVHGNPVIPARALLKAWRTVHDHVRVAKANRGAA